MRPVTAAVAAAQLPANALEENVVTFRAVFDASQ